MLYLASASPRRAELLKTAGLEFDLCVSDFDEKSIPFSSPEEYVLKAATGKANAVLDTLNDNDVVIGSDTAVVLGDRILGKPRDREEAVEMLLLLSGKTHRVLTGVCVASKNKTLSFVETTLVTFIPISREQAEKYAATGECDDKAGAYGIQSKGSVFVSRIEGDYSSVVGLPLCKTVKALEEFGIFPF